MVQRIEHVLPPHCDIWYSLVHTEERDEPGPNPRPVHILSLDPEPFHHIPYLMVAERGRQCGATLPIYRGRVDSLPQPLRAIVCASDLQGRESIGGRLLGHLTAEELSKILGQYLPQMRRQNAAGPRRRPSTLFRLTLRTRRAPSIVQKDCLNPIGVHPDRVNIERYEFECHSQNQLDHCSSSFHVRFGAGS